MSMPFVGWFELTGAVGAALQSFYSTQHPPGGS